ncbi:MAG: hypothetical protein ACTHNW_17995 [Mucilaginibacter sp.]
MRNSFKWLLYGVLAAVIIGLILRLLFDAAWAGALISVMSLSFLLLVPFIIGYVTILIAERKELYSRTYAIIVPWISVFALLCVTLLFSVEGWACWLMALPIFLPMASLGGLTAHRYRKEKHEKLRLSIIVLLPFLLSPIERSIISSSIIYTAYTEINIQAPKEKIWQNVTRVRNITQEQDSARFTRFLGFPRPIKAELDTDAVGGSRLAIFDKGLIFNERVTQYKPSELMVFTIHANPYDIPSTTMDKHIVIGGDYFNVLTGTYKLEPIGKNSYKLKLYSRFKLNTTFNFYAGIWAGWIMKDIQQNILKVIKQRSETNS